MSSFVVRSELQTQMDCGSRDCKQYQLFVQEVKITERKNWSKDKTSCWLKVHAI